MPYEINVSLNGKHYFATTERSLSTEAEAKKLVKHFKNIFPKEDGYELFLSRQEHIGHGININDLI